MRSIEARFNNEVKKNPDISSFICFGRAIKGQRFSNDRIRRYFLKLVDKNDYGESDRLFLFEHFYQLTKNARSVPVGGIKIVSRRTLALR